MADLVGQRWIECVQQIQEHTQQPDITWITGKLTLPADMQARWTHDEQTALSAGAQQHTLIPTDGMCAQRCCEPTNQHDHLCRLCLPQLGRVRGYAS